MIRGSLLMNHLQVKLNCRVLAHVATSGASFEAVSCQGPGLPRKVGDSCATLNLPEITKAGSFNKQVFS